MAVKKMKQYHMMQWVRSNGKRWLFLLTWLTVLVGSQMPVFASADALNGFQSIVPNMTQGSIITTIADGAAVVLGIVTAIAVGFGVIMISWGGINLMFGGGTKKQEGTERIRNAFFGLVVAVGAGVLTGIAVFIADMFSTNATTAANNVPAAMALALVTLLPHIV
jgi:hypothetical protein